MIGPIIAFLFDASIFILGFVLILFILGRFINYFNGDGFSKTKGASQKPESLIKQWRPPPHKFIKSDTKDTNKNQKPESLIEQWRPPPYKFIRRVSEYVSSLNRKGLSGEIEVNLILHSVFKGSEYKLFKDIIVTYSSGTTQIDHVVISTRGIFVIETKSLYGWIFGDKKSKIWTQSIYGRNYKFQNPTHQNYKHIKILQDVLKLDSSKFISIVVFVGNSAFKTNMPVEVVKDRDLRRKIESFRESRIDYRDIESLSNLLEFSCIENNISNRKAHKAHVREIIDSKHG